MSLYHEAASILDSLRKEQTSIKLLLYSKKSWKSDPKTLYALSTEAAKWSEVLAEVVEKSDVLKIEKQLTPTLALVLTHDLFLSKRGIALPASHGLHAKIAQHKARLSAELTKARLRRGCASLDQLREVVNKQATSPASGEIDQTSTSFRHPRWVRVNTLRTTLEEQLQTTFADYEQVGSLSEVIRPTPEGNNSKRLHLDDHIPNLIAIPPHIELTTSKAYKQGHLILQDKASCFPAYLLNLQAGKGDVIDACAAPGNKTTHLAAILDSSSANLESAGRVIACEKDALRSQTLEKMVKVAGGEKVITVKSKQDFMKLDPMAKEFKKVTALLLDPSCSGSGIVGRDEGCVIVHLPSATASEPATASRGKKRKRKNASNGTTSNASPKLSAEAEASPEDIIAEEQPSTTVEDTATKLQTRLANLSSFQLRLLQRAMAFAAARRITYSTCSIHAEENEHVVVKALLSDVARERGWRIMRRSEQVDGMRRWHRRGWKAACEGVMKGSGEGVNVEEVAEGCIRCEKGSEDGTMGFFVAGFVRDVVGAQTTTTEDDSIPDMNGQVGRVAATEDEDEELDEEWGGFED